MARVTPEQAASKWSNRLSGSTEEIRNGVGAVSRAPGASAAAQRQVWLARTQAAADKWARNVSRITLEEWRAAMLEKGLPRIASGAQAAQPKMQQFMTEFLPHVDRVAAQVRTMPKGSLEDGINRAAAQIRGNASFRRGGQG